MAALDDWRTEIEVESGGLVVVVRVETFGDTLQIAPSFPGRNIVRDYLLQERFAEQLVSAHALTLNYAGVDGKFHFVLLNMARARDWQNMEEALLAHEFGHVWLNALGYESPAATAEEPLCVTTHSGDIVQHILIREETRRRGFDYMRFWIRNQEKWMADGGARVADGCARLQLLSAWMDAELGLTAEQWPELGRYKKLVQGLAPELATVAARLKERLAGWDLWDRSLYEAALDDTKEVLLAVMKI